MKPLVLRLHAMFSIPNRMMIFVVISSDFDCIIFTERRVYSSLLKYGLIDFGNFSQQIKRRWSVSVPAKFVYYLGTIVWWIWFNLSGRLLFFTRSEGEVSFKIKFVFWGFCVKMQKMPAECELGLEDADLCLILLCLCLLLLLLLLLIIDMLIDSFLHRFVYSSITACVTSLSENQALCVNELPFLFKLSVLLF